MLQAPVGLQVQTPAQSQQAAAVKSDMQPPTTDTSNTDVSNSVGNDTTASVQPVQQPQVTPLLCIYAHVMHVATIQDGL